MLGVLSDTGHEVSHIGAAYDVGLSPEDPGSDIQQWVNDAHRAEAHWWIGLSLGAAVAHIAACSVPEPRRPMRLTLINPFADRVDLSRQVGFSLGEQWRLSPIAFRSPGGIQVDLIISTHDERITPDHGHQLLTCYPAGDVVVLELEADHSISDRDQQRMLASLLMRR